MAAIKAFFGNTAHCEAMRGTAQQVFNYPKPPRNTTPTPQYRANMVASVIHL